MEIPKDGGKTRPLGIPTVVDRTIQQAITQMLSPLYEPLFSPYSYGFRPGRGAHDAIRQAQEYITNGYVYVVDIDLEKFFDTVNQSKMVELLSRRIKDGRVISLIHKYMRAGIMNGGLYEPSEQGVPQGGPLSPLLSNIMLDELDKELEKRGHPFVRYADDGLIFCKSLRAAERTMSHIITYIEKRLLLRVNQKKTKVGYVGGMKFLGYSFYVKKGECRLRVHPKSVDKMRTRLKELTARSNGVSHEQRKLRLNVYIRGWVEYFKLADMKRLLSRTDEWLRRRLRLCIWKSRYRNLIRCGVDQCRAWMWANTRKGYWHTAGSAILSRAVNNDNLRKTGYIFMSDYYRKVSS